VINDLSEHFGTSETAHLNPRDIKRTPYCFGDIRTLPGLPNESTARSILEELSRDVGVLAVMEKHKFKVGALCELYPEGYVGVSDVCVMGLNEGNGIRILLRLRTDDLKGFRKILSIRKVLFHELAHNMHSDHDSNFYILMRQIEREVVELDWRTSKGKSIGGQSSSNQYIPSERSSNQSQLRRQNRGTTVHILGGIGGNEDRGGSGQGTAVLLPARVAAGTAAIMRLSEEESEAEKVCGSTYSDMTTHARMQSHSVACQSLSQTVTEIPDDIKAVNSTEMDVADADIDSTNAFNRILESHSNVAGEIQLDGKHTEYRPTEGNCNSSEETYNNDQVEDLHREVVTTEQESNISCTSNSSGSTAFIAATSDLGTLVNQLSDIKDLPSDGFESDLKSTSTDLSIIDQTTAGAETNTNAANLTTLALTPHQIPSSFPLSAALSPNTPHHSPLPSENDRFNQVAECVLRQLDEVVSAAIGMSESAPVERLYMLRDALSVLLSRGGGGGGVYDRGSGIATGSYSTHSMSGININDNIDNSNSGRIFSRGDNEGQRNTQSPGHSSATVSDISDTMQLLRTIIGNAKVSY
jgi:hypothetical protein